MEGCTIRYVPDDILVEAAKTAVTINPANRPAAGNLNLLPPEISPPQFLAVMTSKYWGAKGVKLSVSFMDTPTADLRDRILSHMNAWGKYCNVAFVWTQSQGQVRISRGQGGYWSYLGTDILHIPAGQQTMNLQGFTMNSPESEFHRVVRHETGHTLGFPHEHLRAEIIRRLDVRKTVAYFQQTQGWDANMTIAQVLTPLSESSIMGTPHADELSIMTYALPASITVDGRPVIGGSDIDMNDQEFAGKLYPLETLPPTPPKPPNGGSMHTFDFQVADVQTLLSTTSSLGQKLNSGAWLAGFAAQQVFPAAAAQVQAASPMGVPAQAPLTDAEATALLMNMNASGEHALGLPIPWGSLLAWLLKFMAGLNGA